MNEQFRQEQAMFEPFFNPLADREGYFERQIAYAQRLLEGKETSVPTGVINTIKVLSSTGAWFKLSRNLEARSCADAANKRNRIGLTGIPLQDELKSFLGSTTDSSGEEVLVMAHIRGDEQLDMDALLRVVGGKTPIERLSEERIDELGLDYGLVNPLSLATLQYFDDSYGERCKINSPFVQVFDEDTERSKTIPATMMTNAGDFRWGVEFDPKTFIKSIANVKRGVSIVQPESQNLAKRFENRRLAIITGNSSDSGMALWAKVNSHIREMLGSKNTGDISMPYVTVESVPELGLTMELDMRSSQVLPALNRAINFLCSDSTRMPDILTIACNTTPYFTPSIERILGGDYKVGRGGVKFLSMPEATIQHLKHQRIDKVALLGIRYVADLEEWSAYIRPMQEAGIEIETLSARTMEKIHELANDVKAYGATEKGLNQLREVLKEGVESKDIILALTEISQLQQFSRKGQRSDKNFIDPVNILAQAIASELLNRPFPTD